MECRYETTGSFEARKRARKDDSGKKKLTVEQRSQIIAEFKTGNVSKTELAKKYGVSKPRVTQIIVGEAEKIENAMQVLEPGSSLKRLVKGKWQIVEDALLEWLETTDRPLSLAIIQNMALKIAAENNIQGFTASLSWLTRLQKRVRLSRTQDSRLNEHKEDSLSIEPPDISPCSSPMIPQMDIITTSSRIALIMQNLATVQAMAEFDCHFDPNTVGLFSNHINACLQICKNQIVSMPSVAALEHYDIYCSTSEDD